MHSYTHSINRVRVVAFLFPLFALFAGVSIVFLLVAVCLSQQSIQLNAEVDESLPTRFVLVNTVFTGIFFFSPRN